MLTFYGTGMILGAGIYSIIGQAAGIVNAALIRLRRREPQENRPFRIPFSIKTVPILPVLGIAVCFAFLFQFDQLVYLTGLFAFMSSAGIYFLCRRFVDRSSNA